MGRGAAIRRHAAPRFTEVWRHGQKCAGLAEMSTNKNTARGGARMARGAREDKDERKQGWEEMIFVAVDMHPPRAHHAHANATQPTNSRGKPLTYVPEA